MSTCKLQSPKLFISYSWTTPEHEAWVVQLASELESSGVEVKLDKWDLKEGQDSYHFMEQMVLDPSITKVIMVFDQKYKERADKRERGVGVETQIISQEVYSSADQTKFVGVVSDVDENGNAYIPTYYKGRIYIDLSSEEKYATNFQQLERWIYDKPLYQRPVRGQKPAYLNDENAVSLGTEAIVRRCLEAIKSGKPNASGHIIEYLDVVYENLVRFQVQGVDIPNKQEFGTFIYKKIEEFLPYRNEILNIFQNIIIYNSSEDSIHPIHQFFQNLSTYFHPKRNKNGESSYRKWDFDFYKFITYEIFIYTIAILVKYEKFSLAAILLNNPYYVHLDDSYISKEVTNCEFMSNYNLAIKNYYHVEKNTKYYSPVGALVEERCNFRGIDINMLAQADFIIFLNVELRKKRNWYPYIQICKTSRRQPYEIFMKAISLSYFERIKCLFNIENVLPIHSLLDDYQNNINSLPRIDEMELNISTLINIDVLATES